ncbi:MAG: ABC transporter permease [Candidatus Dependentiae bacterium]
MNIALLLAKRYLLRHQEKNISVMLKICFLALFVGSLALALVLCIMQGFETATHEKLRGIHAPIIMQAGGQALDSSAIGKVLNEEFPEIVSWSSSALKQIIVQNPQTTQTSHVVLLKGIDAQQEHLVTNIAQMITKQLVSWPDLLQDNQIIIGNKLAQDLQATIGSEVTLLYSPIDSYESKKINLESTTATISGIFNTGIEEFDNGLIISSLSFFSELFPEEGVTQISIKTAPTSDENKLVKRLKERFENLSVYSWKDLYPALVSALKLEKYAMFFVVSLMILVASMNIISLLYMQIIQKRADIAILKTLGASSLLIRRIFFWYGMIISFIAALSGLFTAWIIGLLLKKYIHIPLPDSYYVTYVPIELNWHLFALVFGVIIGISLLAVRLPLRTVERITILNLLRFEV